MNDRLHREQVAFLERHKDADLLVVDTRTRKCTEAIYYSPMKKAQDGLDASIKRFFQLVKECELEEEE